MDLLSPLDSVHLGWTGHLFQDHGSVDLVRLDSLLWLISLFSERSVIVDHLVNCHRMFLCVEPKSTILPRAKWRVFIDIDGIEGMLDSDVVPISGTVTSGGIDDGIK